MKKYERVKALVSLDAIAHNFEEMHKNVKEGTKIIAVIKADGYGHGARAIARLIQDYDYIWGFATATAEEALELRHAGITKPVLILGLADFGVAGMTVTEDRKKSVDFTDPYTTAEQVVIVKK